MKRLFRTRDFLPNAERDLTDEIRSHAELQVEDLIARGLSEDQARAEAHQALERMERAHAGISFHSRTRLRRRSLLDQVGNLVRDVRFALRRMARSPGFTLIAVVSLAIGIGANTTVFSVVNGLFLRPPPFHDPEELVQVWIGRPGRPTSGTSYREYQGLLDVEDVFVGIGAVDGIIGRIRDEQGTRSAYMEAVTPNLFPMLGLEPALGRFFHPEEGADPGGNPLVILGHGYWLRAFGGDQGILGETISVAGRRFTIIGVAPPELSALETPTLISEFFIPISMASVVSGRGISEGAAAGYPWSTNILARLAPGITREVAEDRIGGIAREIREDYGRSAPEGWVFRLWPIKHQAIDPAVDAGLVRIAVFLQVIAGMVLLLACTNLASLLLARGADREREIAVRLALGAGRRRLLSQLISETVLLTVLGGVAGFFLAQWALGLLLRLQPNVGVTLSLDHSADVKVLLFTLATAGLAVLIFGLAPSLAVTRRDVSLTLKGELAPAHRRLPGLGGVLVAIQMSVSVILLTGGGLFCHSLLVAQNTNPGFSTEDGVTVWVDLEKSGLPASEWLRVSQELRDRVSSRAGVQLIGMADYLPLLGRDTENFTIPSSGPPAGRESHWANRFRVDEGYLRAMGIPLLSGRGIEPTDLDGAQDVVLVSQAAAQRFWPGESPLGKEMISEFTDRSYQVVGVVGDVKVDRLSDPPEPVVYFSFAQHLSDEVHLVARGSMTTSELGAAVRQAVEEVDPDLLIMLIQTLEERLAVNLYPARMAALLLGTFGLTALMLAAIGLFGVVSLTGARRTREMAIRMSLGADTGRVMAMILRGSLVSVMFGGLIGLGVAFALAHLIRSFLFGVEPADPLTFLCVPILLGGVSFIAAFIPARRLSRVDPMEWLRTE